MKYIAYQHVKASGTEWLGDVPSHWATIRLRFLLTEKFANGLFKKSEFWGNGTRIINVTDLYLENDLIDETRLARVECTDEELNCFEVRHGDFFVVRSSLKSEGIGKSAVVLAPGEPTVFECHIVRGRPNLAAVHPRFLNYFMNSSDARYYFVTYSNVVTMATIDQEKIKNLSLPLPEFDEQHQIANFLDWKTGQIDALIAKKRVLLDKLKEKRLAVITQAVTRGLNPDAPMRDSGIAWLGEVPAHWGVSPLGYLMTMSGGMTPSLANSEFWGGRIPWVSPKDMKQPRISNSIDHITEKAVEKTSIGLVPVNSVLIVVRGMILAHSFPTAVTEKNVVTINQDMKALKASEKLEVEYLFWALTGYAKIFSALALESAHGTRKLESETIKKFAFPVPPIAEQEEVSKCIQEKMKQLDSMALASELTITHLTEYRTALITAATTGKIDVRGIQVSTEHTA